MVFEIIISIFISIFLILGFVNKPIRCDSMLPFKRYNEDGYNLEKLQNDLRENFCKDCSLGCNTNNGQNCEYACFSNYGKVNSITSEKSVGGATTSTSGYSYGGSSISTSFSSSSSFYNSCTQKWEDFGFKS